MDIWTVEVGQLERKNNCFTDFFCSLLVRRWFLGLSSTFTLNLKLGITV